MIYLSIYIYTKELKSQLKLEKRTIIIQSQLLVTILYQGTFKGMPNLIII